MEIRDDSGMRTTRWPTPPAHTVPYNPGASTPTPATARLSQYSSEAFVRETMLSTSNRLSKQCATSVRSAAHLASRQSDRNALHRLGLARSLSAATASMEDALDTTLTCNSCKTVVTGSPSPLFKCPNSHSASEADHVLMPSAVSAAEIASLVEMGTNDAAAATSANPFIRFRALLYPYRVAMASGMR